jgi:hypothetical protein
MLKPASRAKKEIAHATRYLIQICEVNIMFRLELYHPTCKLGGARMVQSLKNVFKTSLTNS